MIPFVLMPEILLILIPKNLLQVTSSLLATSCNNVPGKCYELRSLISKSPNNVINGTTKEANLHMIQVNLVNY